MRRRRRCRRVHNERPAAVVSNVGDDTFAARIDLDGVFPVSMLYVLARKGDTIVWADQQLGVDKVVRWSGGCQRRPELAAHRLAPALRAWVGYEVQRVSPISGPSLPKLTVDAPAMLWAKGLDGWTSMGPDRRVWVLLEQPVA